MKILRTRMFPKHTENTLYILMFLILASALFQMMAAGFVFDMNLIRNLVIPVGSVLFLLLLLYFGQARANKGWFYLIIDEKTMTVFHRNLMGKEYSTVWLDFSKCLRVTLVNLPILGYALKVQKAFSKRFTFLSIDLFEKTPQEIFDWIDPLINGSSKE